MTDIEFDQITVGQKIRVHYTYADGGVWATAEGGVVSTDPASWLHHDQPRSLCLGTAEACRSLPFDAIITRVELLSEPAPPKWEVGQLASVEFYEGADEPPGATVAYWSGVAWESTEGFGQQAPEHIVGEPRLLKPVPADAVVLPGDTFRNGWPNPDTLRRVADKIKERGSNWGWKILHATADALEAHG